MAEYAEQPIEGDPITVAAHVEAIRSLFNLFHSIFASVPVYIGISAFVYQTQ